jgi:hypothetical protein
MSKQVNKTEMPFNYLNDDKAILEQPHFLDVLLNTVEHMTESDLTKKVRQDVTNIKKRLNIK